MTPETEPGLDATAERDALAEDEQACHEDYERLAAVARHLAAALEFHRLTPTGHPRECLSECVGCAALAEYARLREGSAE